MRIMVPQLRLNGRAGMVFSSRTGMVFSSRRGVADPQCKKDASQLHDRQHAVEQQTPDRLPCRNHDHHPVLKLAATVPGHFQAIASSHHPS
jgi:hypothetical protein